ncbi:hypothetical protein DRO44_00935 [Candidatus Bathyarchaeota archaeon]|nr:MAG: hypothetical protein DRO44_00935 [Candidatus Bathyarchaeota archaeon]
MVNPLEWLLMPQAPGATVAIMIICALISFANSSINRFLINRLVGWKQYRIMQKEIAEYQSLTRQALRTKDKKLMEKIKKKEPQIMNMQKKMAKPQLIMFAIPFLYLLVWWLVLLPLYGANPVAYIPGIGGIPIFYWYFIASSLFGILASRLLGMMPIE